MSDVISDMISELEMRCHIYIYDSCFVQESVTPNLAHQICEIYSPLIENNVLKITCTSVQQQKEKMRSHLADCFETCHIFFCDF